jgi:hypothetical protein
MHTTASWRSGLYKVHSGKVHRVSGAMYRRVATNDYVGKLGEGQKCFGQLYFIDICDATNHRSTGVGSYGLKIDLMSDLDVMLRKRNAKARSYKQMHEVCDHLQKKKKGTLPVQDVQMVFETNGIPNPGLYKKNYTRNRRAQRSQLSLLVEDAIFRNALSQYSRMVIN